MSRHAVVDRRVEQAIAEMEMRRLGQAGIIAQAERCPACDHGWITRYDEETASRWRVQCQACEGTGRVLVQTVSLPNLKRKIREWWKGLVARP